MSVQSRVTAPGKETVAAASAQRVQRATNSASSVESATRARHSFGEIAIHPAPHAAIQPKLMIGSVDDPYEREADRVARQVVSRIDAPTMQRQDEPRDEEEQVQTAPARSTLQRQPEAEEDEEERLQPKSESGAVQRQAETEEDDEENLQKKTQIRRQADGSMAATSAMEAAIQQQRGGGRPLPAGTRTDMEQAFGADFAGVRVHTDAQADQLNRSIQARAFTTGQDIFMRQGEYRPYDRVGQELLAHELTHVVQQDAEGS